jgi:hypothetical protein
MVEVLADHPVRCRPGTSRAGQAAPMAGGSTADGMLSAAGLRIRAWNRSGASTGVRVPCPIGR